jgi:hypothetical protein
MDHRGEPAFDENGGPDRRSTGRIHRLAMARTKIFCGAALMALLAFAALAPSEWVPRTGLGYRIEHFLVVFAFTSIACLAWPRPLLVGGAFMAASALLEGLEVLTPDRTANLEAALYGAAGALLAALLAAVIIRVWRHARRKVSHAEQSVRRSAGYRYGAPLEENENSDRGWSPRTPQ